MQLKINLATRNYINLHQLTSVIFIIITLLLLLLIFNVRGIAYNAAEIKRITGETTLLAEKAKSGVKKVPETAYKDLLARIHFANAVIEKKSFNWLQLFASLEEVVPDGVAISMIEPDIKGQLLKLSGSARNFNNLRRLMENFENSKYFTDVYLLTQGEIKVGVGQKGLNFTISCRTDYK